MWILRLLILLSALTIPAIASPAVAAPFAGLHDVERERQAIHDQVSEAIAKKDFTGLNRMARDLRIRRARTSGGTWKLADFYASLAFDLRPDRIEGQCRNDAAPFVRSWAAAAPAEPAAHIVEARLLIEHAWCFRGAGDADSVSPEAWPLFRRNVDAALKVLDARNRAAAIDPEYYAVMEEIYLYQGRGKAEFRRLLDTGVAREPYYYSLYFQALRYYQPQWHGSNEEADALARYAAEHTKQEDGLGAYARVYWYATQCNCGLDHTGIDKLTMRQAMRDVITRHPSDWNAANFAKLACQIGDGNDAAVYLGMIRPDDGSVWDDQRKWQACVKLAGYSGNVARQWQSAFPGPVDPSALPGAGVRSTERCASSMLEHWSAAEVATYCGAIVDGQGHTPVK